MRSNTQSSYGSVARAFHWLTALLILTAAGLGLYAVGLPTGTDAEAAAAIQVFSLHKTIGVAAFFTAAARILWALTQARPHPLRPERRVETALAETIHWALYGAMLIMPLSGWVDHAAKTGFAPILWPFGQGLPFVPASEAVAAAAAAVHETSAWVLYAAVGLHVAGALKHAVIDRDGTLARMTRGTEAGPADGHSPNALPALAAIVVWVGVLTAGVLPLATPPAVAPMPEATATQAEPGMWSVTEGQLTFAVRQMGADVSGSLPDWTAEIVFDEATGTGRVSVKIDTTSLTLGSVTEQAAGPDFFDTATHPVAVFTADIAPEGAAYVAKGTLTLRGAEVPVTLPFTLEFEGDVARMAAQLTLDRRDFGMGTSYPDEGTVGFGVRVDVSLAAKRPVAQEAPSI